MKAVFIELPAFERHLAGYLDDDGFQSLQDDLVRYPTAGNLIEGTGGLCKVRHANSRRGEGKRSGLGVI